MSWDDFSAKMRAPLSGGALQLGAMQLYLTGQMPQMGMGGSGVAGQTRLAVMEGRAKIAAELGVSPEQAVSMPANWKSEASNLTKLSVKRGQLDAIVSSFHNNIATFESVAEGQPPKIAGDRIAALGSEFQKIDFTDVQALNKLKLAVTKQFNDPATVAYVTAAVTVAMDYARILSSQGQSAAQVTDSARNEALSLISTGYNKSARQALIGTLESDTAGQMQGLEKSIDSTKQRMSLIQNKGSAPSADQPNSDLRKKYGL